MKLKAKSVFNADKRNGISKFYLVLLIIILTAGLTACTTAIGAVHGNLAPSKDLNSITPTIYENQSTATTETQMVTLDNVDMRYYEGGKPYVHWNWTNNTNQTITSCQFVMLAYDKDGKALDLHWNFLNSSKSSSFENLVNDKVEVSSGKTYDSDGGWSILSNEAEQVSYVIACIKKIELADGSTWENPEYALWLEKYKEKPVDVEVLKAYYPH